MPTIPAALADAPGPEYLPTYRSSPSSRERSTAFAGSARIDVMADRSLFQALQQGGDSLHRQIGDGYPRVDAVKEPRKLLERPIDNRL